LKENIPLKPVPVPDLLDYQRQITAKLGLSYPLKSLPAYSLSDLPRPLNLQKRGWPWDVASDTYLSATNVPTISVVIPSYQQGAFIEETIRSVLLQNYGAIELIVIDGGSTDDTLKVLDYYKDLLSLYISEPDNGQAQAVNKGFSMSSGAFCYWLNSDDFLTINCFNKVLPVFNSGSKPDIIYGDGYKLEEATGKLAREYAPLVRERYLRFGGIVLSHSVIWRREVHCAVWEQLNCAMDAELWLRLFTGHSFKHSLLPIGVARIHTEQKSAGGDQWFQRWKEDYEQYIWQWYPPIKQWLWRTREYRLVQQLFMYYRRLFTL
jgi:glycosyltransferase involved in cell wall biosynthesis